jgi:Phage portal protein, SPP1 Gp6-like
VAYDTQTDETVTPLDLAYELQEYRAHRTNGFTRINEMYTARQARRNIFTWPSTWDPWKKKVVYPMVRKAELTHANFLMGRGFNLQIEPLGTGPDQREAAQRAEKALFKLIDDCDGWQTLWRGARHGSLLGTSAFKVYTRKGKDGKERACFASCQPEFIFPVTRGDDYLDLVKVFYGYSVDRTEANLQYGVRDWKSEREVDAQYRQDEVKWRRDKNLADSTLSDRRIPVLEVWTDKNYMKVVGGEVIYNGANTYGFVPYVVIPNIDSTEDVWGLSDVDALIPLNQELNELLSEHRYITRRWMNPTIVWEGAPPGYAETAANILGGGGILPTRPGGRIYFLAHEGQGPDITGLMERLRTWGIEVAGLNEIAWSGQPPGGWQTAPSLEINFSTILATLGAKQTMWAAGLKKLFYMLLELGAEQKDIGVVDSPYAKTAKDRSMRLTGKDIGGHRSIKVEWPGLMPKDDMSAARFEMEKHAGKVQSKFTTLEKLGFDFPSDELQRLEEEMRNEGLNPEGNADLMRAQASMVSAEARGGGAEGGAAPEDLEGEGLDELPEEEPQGLDELNEFPPGVGTMSDGRAVDDMGNELGPVEQELAMLRAQQLRNRPPIEMGQPEAELPEAV